MLSPFASLFDARPWRKVQILLPGVIPVPGRRTVSTALYVLGLPGRDDFALFHHVLSRASWSSLAVSRVLPGQLVRHRVPTGPLRLAVDETLERRWGEKIEALGVYRDPVRSSHGHFVKAKGLRWVGLMLLAEVSWARRVWALPFPTVPAPSRRYHEARGRRHKTITDWARQMLCLLRRWLPDRELVVVGDRTYATLKLLAACQQMTPPVTFLTRLRLDAVLHDPPPPRKPGQMGRPRVVGTRQPSLQALLTDPATVWTPLTRRWPDGTRRHLQAATGTALWYHPGQPTVALRWLLLRDPSGRRDPQALLCTDPDWSPKAILTTYLQRWQVAVTFQEVRTHLGVETQRQGSAAAIARTTPVLLGLSAGSSWRPTTCAGRVPSAPAKPPGMPRPSPPAPMSWPASATSSGCRPRLFPCPRPPPTSANGPSRRPHRSWTPSATRPDTLPTPHPPRRLCTKSSSEVWSEYDETTLVLRATSASWPAAVPLFLNQVTRPELDRWDLDGYRSTIVDEIRARDDDPFETAHLQLRASLYGVGGYANPLLGTLDSVNYFDLDEVDQFHERIYTTDNMVFVAAGNFDPRLMLSTLAQHLGRLPPSSMGQDSNVGHVMFEAPRTVSSNRDGIQLSWMMIGVPGPDLGSVDYPAFQILNSVMGSGASSRLFTYFREQEGNVYVAYSHLTGLKHGGFIELVVQVLPEDAGKFVDYALSEVRTIAEHGISDEELQVAIAREVGHQLRLHEWIGTSGMLQGIDILLGVQHTGAQGLILQFEGVSVDDIHRVAGQVVGHHVVSEVVPSGQR